MKPSFYPQQTARLGKPVRVVFGDMGEAEDGFIVRDDAFEPNVTIVLTESGKYLLESECHQFNVEGEQS